MPTTAVKKHKISTILFIYISWSEFFKIPSITTVGKAAEFRKSLKDDASQERKNDREIEKAAT